MKITNDILDQIKHSPYNETEPTGKIWGDCYNTVMHGMSDNAFGQLNKLVDDFQTLDFMILSIMQDRLYKVDLNDGHNFPELS